MANSLLKAIAQLDKLSSSLRRQVAKHLDVKQKGKPRKTPKGGKSKTSRTKKTR